MRKINSKGQLTLGDAPTVVLLIGLVFLVMATMAFIGQKYGDAMPSDELNTVVNETATQLERNIGTVLDGGLTDCNPTSFAITNVTNGTGNLQVLSTNYTLDTSTGAFLNLSGAWGDEPNWLVTYTYYDSDVACDVNRDLETNISDNTSIAGIVLTISLVGIVLTILIGVFIGVRGAGSRV